MKVKLETSDGEHVGHSHVPPFNKPPDVLLWGDRVFKLHEDAKHGAVVYRECFAVAIVVPVTD